MSAGGEATRSREIPAVRRVAVHDSAHMPQDYCTTPGGTVFSTTPGGDLGRTPLNTFKKIILRRILNDLFGNSIEKDAFTSLKAK